MKSILFILLVSLVESIAYPGFIKNHFFIPAFIIYLILGIYAFKNPRLSQLTQTQKKIINLAAVLTIIIYTTFNIVESITYNNFIFTHLHINLQGFAVFTLLFLISSFYLTKQSLILGSMIFLGIFNIAGITPILLAKLTPIITNPFATYDQKMTHAYGEFYQVMQQVKILTPEDSTIVIPPQSAPWVDEGNDALVRRFLYPRTITHLDNIDLTQANNTFVLIAIGHWPEEGNYTHGWPKQIIPSDHIWHLDPRDNKIEKIVGVYDPNFNWDWGLIEVKYE